MNTLAVAFWSLLIVSPVLALVVWMTAQLVRVRRVYRLRKDLIAFFTELNGRDGNEAARRCNWAIEQPNFQQLEKGWGDPSAKLSGEYADIFRAWRRNK